MTETLTAGKTEAQALPARHDGIGELNVPRQLHIVKEVPLLGTGKIDYPGVTQLIAACKTETET